jgi:hypothetical protein
VLLRGAPAELWSIAASSPPPTAPSRPAGSSSPFPFSASCLRLLDLPFAAAAWIESPVATHAAATRANRLAFALADGRVGALDICAATGAARDASPRRPAGLPRPQAQQVSPTRTPSKISDKERKEYLAELKRRREEKTKESKPLRFASLISH